MLAELRALPEPGRPWPLVGHLPLVLSYLLTSHGHVADGLQRLLLRSGEVNLRLRIGAQWIYLITDPPSTERILSHGFRAFPKSAWEKKTLNPLMAGGLILLDGAAWKQHHDLLTPYFRASVLQRLIPIAVATVAERSQTWSSRIEFGHEMQALTMDIMMRYLMQAPVGQIEGEPVLDRCAQQFRRAEIELEKLVSPAGQWRAIAQRRLGLQTPFDRSISSLIGLVNNRIQRIYDRDPRLKNSLAADMLDRFESRQAVSQELVTLFAASTTTAHLLSWIGGLLATHPDVQRRLRAELRTFLQRKRWSGVTRQDLDELVWLQAVIQEATRLYPPAPLMLRQLNAAGDLAVLFLWGMHRRPDDWPEPDTFRPKRWSTNPRPHFIPLATAPEPVLGKAFRKLKQK